MANLFAATADTSGTHFQLSNSASGLMVEIFSLAASRIAESDWEIELASWLSSHDQGVCGLGVVGFDLDEIAWSSEEPEFAQQKEHFSKILAEVLNESGWDLLDYSPRKESAEDIVAGFRGLLDELGSSDVDLQTNGFHWTAERPVSFARCSKHGVYEHSSGCVICNN